MPKGENLRPKQEMDQLSYHLRILKIVELEFLFWQNSLNVSSAKSWSLVGRVFDYGKKGEFLNL